MLAGVEGEPLPVWPSLLQPASTPLCAGSQVLMGCFQYLSLRGGSLGPQFGGCLAHQPALTSLRNCVQKCDAVEGTQESCFWGPDSQACLSAPFLPLHLLFDSPTVLTVCLAGWRRGLLSPVKVKLGCTPVSLEIQMVIQGW